VRILLLGLAGTFLSPSALAQGTVVFNNRVTGVVIAPVYSPEVGNSCARFYGNTTNGFPAGETVYTGTPLAGAGWSAQLFAAAGENQPESALTAASSVTTFRTGTAAGFVVATVATLNGVPQDAPVATVQLRVWDNYGGTINTWSEAEWAFFGGWISAGKSKPFNVYQIGGVLNDAPALAGLRSFNVTPDCAPQPYIVEQPRSQHVHAGTNVTFAVGVVGQPPFAFLWRSNNVHIPDATNNSYTIFNVQTNYSGNYSVLVTNEYGALHSSIAVLNVHPSASPAFFGMAFGTNGAFQFTLSGVPDYTYIIEASTNLLDWTPFLTNKSPISYSDQAAPGFSARYYRSRYAP
jgi:hypothetical protein